MKKLLLTGFALVSMVSQAQTWVDQATQFPLNFGEDEMVIVDANTFGFLPTMVQAGELTQKLFLKPSMVGQLGQQMLFQDLVGTL